MTVKLTTPEDLQALAQALAPLIADAAGGRPKKPKPPITMAELAERWQTDWGRTIRSGRPKRSLGGEAYRWAFLVEVIGPTTPLGTLERSDFERIARAIEAIPKVRDGRPRSGADINRFRERLRAGMRAAAERGFDVDLTALSGWRPRPEAPPHNRTATRAEYERLIDGEVTGRYHQRQGGRRYRRCRDDLRTIIILGANTGMRLGEICGLRWEHVDLRRRVALLPMTKNGEARRVALNHEAAAALKRWKKDHGSKFGGRVFSAAARTSNMSPRFKRLTKALGLEGVRFHSLRHTAAANMARAKVQWPTIKAQCGWKSDAMFARYANPTPADQLAAVDAAEFDESAW